MLSSEESTKLRQALLASLSQKIATVEREIIAEIDAALSDQSTSTNIITQSPGNYAQNATSYTQRALTQSATELIRTGTLDLERIGNRLLRDAGQAVGEYVSQSLFDQSNYTMRRSNAQQAQSFSANLSHALRLQ